MIGHNKPTKTLLLVIGFAIVTSCSSTPPTNFYILSPVPAAQDPEKALTSGHSPTVGLGPVDFPLYLDRPQIVTRRSPNDLELAEFEQWAEPLKDNFTRVLVENLALFIPTDRIAPFPWERRVEFDYQIVVNVARFDAETGNSVLVARWSILDRREREMFSQHSVYRESLGTRDVAGAVAAMNRTVNALSRDIANAIRKLAAT